MGGWKLHTTLFTLASLLRWWLCSEYWVIFWQIAIIQYLSALVLAADPGLLWSELWLILWQYLCCGHLQPSDLTLTPFHWCCESRLCISTQSRFLSSFNLARQQMSMGSCQKVNPNWWWPSLITTSCSGNHLHAQSHIYTLYGWVLIVNVSGPLQTAIMSIEMMMLVSFRSKTMNYDSSLSDRKRTFSH